MDQRGDVKQSRNQLIFALLIRYLSNKITEDIEFSDESYKSQIFELNYLNIIVAQRRVRVPVIEMFFEKG
jgi:hypothetical protein